MNKILELREKRAKTWENAKNFLDNRRNENGIVSDEDNAVYEKMADTFTKTDLRVALQRAFVKSPVRSVICLWHKNKLIEKRGDTYVKIKNNKNNN